MSLGRRGVFDGVIEGLHQHWKHKEVVKVITMQKVFSHIVNTAKLLQRQSGGILISVENLKEGHAIILYRGKNYRRPLKLVSQNLLSKRQALERSLEMQRVGVSISFCFSASIPYLYIMQHASMGAELIFVSLYIQSLKFFAYQRQRTISDLERELVRDLNF